jgi:hypothetical protein
MKSEITSLIRRYGEPVELTPQGGATLYIQASVQLPVNDALVNDYDMTSFIVYVSPDDVPVKPTKFDRIKIRGTVRSIEEVHEETAEGQRLVYILRVRG